MRSASRKISGGGPVGDTRAGTGVDLAVHEEGGLRKCQRSPRLVCLPFEALVISLVGFGPLVHPA